jgi:hypothetical protein
LAFVADIIVTFVTSALAPGNGLELAWDLMIEANAGPSCSRLTRLATEVLALKKAVQPALICDWAAELGDAAGAEAVAAEPAADVVLVLPQAATAAPHAHTRRIWDSVL